MQPWVLGLMSGTSLDGIDAALIRSDGVEVSAIGAFHSAPYDPAFRERLRGVLGETGPVAAVAQELTLLHAEAVRRLLHEAGMEPREIDVIGFHGHTIWHAPRQGRTRQIGDGALLAAETGIDVVADFRSNDVAAGGEGAPLAPLFHAALASRLERPLAVLNLGGVGNVTWIAADRDDGSGVPGAGETGILAFDTGPGNALLNDWMEHCSGAPLDRDGALARQGRVDEAALAALLDNPYFALTPPKSLDRDHFDASPVAGLSPADGAATLTAFTAAAVARAGDHFPAPPKRWLVTGGGRLNPVLMAAMAQRLPVAVEAVESVGWNGDALEAQAFAFLAARSRRGLPLSLPTTTGVSAPINGGVLFECGARAAR